MERERRERVVVNIDRRGGDSVIVGFDRGGNLVVSWFFQVQIGSHVCSSYVTQIK